MFLWSSAELFNKVILIGGRVRNTSRDTYFILQENFLNLYDWRLHHVDSETLGSSRTLALTQERKDKILYKPLVLLMKCV